MKPPFRLVQAPAVSHDTVAALEALLKAARRGEVIGMAYAAMMKSRRFVVNTTGEPHRNPTFALGMVRILDDVLTERARSDWS
jgi:hypothetical protein